MKGQPKDPSTKAKMREKALARWARERVQKQKIAALQAPRVYHEVHAQPANSVTERFEASGRPSDDDLTQFLITSR